MDNKISPTSIRLTREEKTFLEKVAIDNNLINVNSKPLLTSAMKLLIREKMNAKPTHENKLNSDISQIKNMLQQIHSSLDIKSDAEGSNQLIQQFKCGANDYLINSSDLDNYSFNTKKNSKIH